MTFDEWWNKRVCKVKSKYPNYHYSDEINASVKASHNDAWVAAQQNIVENETSHNSASRAIAAIEHAIRVKDIWLPPEDCVDEEHADEIAVLWRMYREFESVLRQQQA